MCEKKELDYFRIGASFGGSQEWFGNYLMKMGGCAAVTACDSCIYFARNFGRGKLYPYNTQNLSREDYVSFGMRMKPYLHPRIGGVNRPEMYINGFQRYLREIGEELPMEPFSGGHPYGEAEEFVREQIGAGFPVPYLMLRHKNTAFQDFVWHWFLLVGFEERKDGFYVTTATYGQARSFKLAGMWDTRMEEKGGMVRYL